MKDLSLGLGRSDCQLFKYPVDKSEDPQYTNNNFYPGIATSLNCISDQINSGIW